MVFPGSIRFQKTRFFRRDPGGQPGHPTLGSGAAVSLNCAMQAPVSTEASRLGKLRTNSASTLEVGGDPWMSFTDCDTVDLGRGVRGFTVGNGHSRRNRIDVITVSTFAECSNRGTFIDFLTDSKAGGVTETVTILSIGNWWQSVDFCFRGHQPWCGRKLGPYRYPKRALQQIGPKLTPSAMSRRK